MTVGFRAISRHVDGQPFGLQDSYPMEIPEAQSERILTDIQAFASDDLTECLTKFRIPDYVR